MARHSYRPEAFPVAMRCGTHVSLKVDPRHIGRVVAVYARYTIRVRWPNGWKSDHEVDELERA
jgi:hypothetical protein